MPTVTKNEWLRFSVMLDKYSLFISKYPNGSFLSVLNDKPSMVLPVPYHFKNERSQYGNRIPVVNVDACVLALVQT